MALYVCATPIGNLEDVSLRLLATLRNVSLICAEDTRHTRRLLARHDITTPLASCHQHTPPRRIAQLADDLASGQEMALVTDAGTPGVSDPGPALVQAAVERGVPVIPVPGPCALAAALSVSGLDAQRFSFIGFLPRKPGRRRQTLQQALDRQETIVIYESPYRAGSTLEELAALAPDRSVVLCRELTKTFEEVRRGSCLQVAREFADTGRAQGEFVIMVGASNSQPDGAVIEEVATQ